MMTPEAGTDPHAMKTLLVVPWDEKRGGVISVVHNLARHLRAEQQEVLFFHSAGTVFLRRRVTKLGFPGVQLRLVMPFGPGLRGLARTLLFPVFFTTGLLQLLWFLRSQRIQFVNLHYPIDAFVYFAICRRILNIRLVTSVHGRDAFSEERPKEHYSSAFRFVIQSSDLIILPSDAYRRKLLEAFPSVRQRTIFIHNGIDPAQFCSASDRPMRLGEDKNRYILCVAELQEYKAIDVLLHAAKLVLAGDPSLTLVLAGDGPLRSDLEDLASSLGIRERTMFLGSQGPLEIVRLLRGCEVMVLPSRMEPFGIALIEAMACKAPVVATEVGGIPEIVEHETSGILVPPENPEALAAGIQRVLTDRNLGTVIAENGYARVMERFCSIHNGVEYLRAFASIRTDRAAQADSSTPPHVAERIADALSLTDSQK